MSSPVNVKGIMGNTIVWYLVPSLIMFAAGVYGFITRKNMIAMLISLELMLGKEKPLSRTEGLQSESSCRKGSQGVE